MNLSTLKDKFWQELLKIVAWYLLINRETERFSRMAIGFRAVDLLELHPYETGLEEGDVSWYLR